MLAMFGQPHPQPSRPAAGQPSAGRPRLGEQLGKAAVRFMVAEGDIAPEELGAAIGRCAVHLVGLGMADRDQALELAMVAWADLEGRKTRCYVDLAASSPHLLFLVDPVAGERRAIPVVDLIRMLGPRAVG